MIRPISRPEVYRLQSSIKSAQSVASGSRQPRRTRSSLNKIKEVVSISSEDAPEARNLANPPAEVMAPTNDGLSQFDSAPESSNDMRASSDFVMQKPARSVAFENQPEPIKNETKDDCCLLTRPQIIARKRSSKTGMMTDQMSSEGSGVAAESTAIFQPKSSTSMGTMMDGPSSKLDAIRAEIQQKNDEITHLQDEIKRRRDSNNQDEVEILRTRLETAKSYIRTKVKTAMLEQRLNKEEMFDPISITLFDDLGGNDF